MASIDKKALIEQAKIKQQKTKAEIAKKKRQKVKSYVDMPEPTGDVEKDSYADLNAVQKGFRDAIKREDK